MASEWKLASSLTCVAAGFDAAIATSAVDDDVTTNTPSEEEVDYNTDDEFDKDTPQAYSASQPTIVYAPVMQWADNCGGSWRHPHAAPSTCYMYRTDVNVASIPAVAPRSSVSSAFVPQFTGEHAPHAPQYSTMKDQVRDVPVPQAEQSVFVPPMRMRRMHAFSSRDAFWIVPQSDQPAQSSFRAHTSEAQLADSSCGVPKGCSYTAAELSDVDDAARRLKNHFELGGCTRRREPSGLPFATKDQCAQLVQDLQAGGRQCEDALATMKTHVVELSYDKDGCRVVQLAFQKAARPTAEELIKELHGEVFNLNQSPHGNYVIQKVVDLYPLTIAGFVIDELTGIASIVARSKYGCRVLHRIFEHTTADSESAVALAWELIMSTAQLAKHEFGHFVLQAILEHGSADQKNWIADVLTQHLWSFIWNKSASYVLETAMTYCDVVQQQTICYWILRAEHASIVRLATNQSGVHVLGAVLKLHSVLPSEMWPALSSVAAELPKTRFGKLLLSRDAEVAAIVCRLLA